MEKLTLNVEGLTCASCEVLLERKLKQVPGVEKVRASKAKDQVTVSCSEEVDLPQLQQAIQDKGYSLMIADDSSSWLKTKLVTKDKSRWAEIGSVLVIMIGAYVLLSQLDVLPQGLSVTENMSYGFVFLIGLVAATSTCLAVSGGLLLAIVTKYQRDQVNLTTVQKFKPHLFFNVGRIISYTLFGGIIGLLGSMFTLSSGITGMVTIIASILMIIVGLQLLHIFPWLDRVQVKMPKFIAHKLYGASAEKKTFNNKTAFLFGAATFFLPCGFTQALQLYVLGRGDVVTGALTMLLFSLGTLPALISIGAFTSFTKGSVQKYFTIFSALLVIVLGIFNLAPGFNLTGATIGLPDLNNDPAVTADDFNIVDGKQIINLKVDGLDYSPDTFVIKKGIPVQWNIDGRGARGCAQIINVPKLNILEQLPRDQVKTITFTPTEIGKITFSCSMGMAGPGVFKVVP